MAVRKKYPLPRPEPFTETICLHSEVMIASAEQFFARQPDFSSEFPGFNIRGTIPAPYLFWYHYRSAKALENLDKVHRDHMELLTGWINKTCSVMYSRVDDQLKRGMVSSETMPFLVKPGNALVSLEKGTLRAFVASSWTFRTNSQQPPPFLQRPPTDWSSDAKPARSRPTWSWSVRAWSYKYDGRFYRNAETPLITLSADHLKTEVEISQLSMYPVEYARREVKDLLVARGETFWGCRNKRLVAYRDEGGVYNSVRLTVYTMTPSGSYLTVTDTIRPSTEQR